jgi:hypothetical protein
LSFLFPEPGFDQSGAILGDYADVDVPVVDSGCLRDFLGMGAGVGWVPVLDFLEKTGDSEDFEGSGQVVGVDALTVMTELLSREAAA